MDFHSMKRKNLQALCKKHKIPANGTNVAMGDRLSSLLKKPETEPKAKKVRFSLDDVNAQVIDLTKSEERGDKIDLRRIKSSMKPGFERSNLNIHEVPARSTRSRRASVVADLVSQSPIRMSKRKRDDGGEGKEKEPIIVCSSTLVERAKPRRGKNVDGKKAGFVSNGDKEIDVGASKSLRSREIVSDRGKVEHPEKEIIKEPEKAPRRSTRRVSKIVASQSEERITSDVMAAENVVVESVPENAVPQRTRRQSRILSTNMVSGPSEEQTTSKPKDHPRASRSTLSKKKQSTDAKRQKVRESQFIVEEHPKRSKRISSRRESIALNSDVTVPAELILSNSVAGEVAVKTKSLDDDVKKKTLNADANQSDGNLNVVDNPSLIVGSVEDKPGNDSLTDSLFSLLHTISEETKEDGNDQLQKTADGNADLGEALKICAESSMGSAAEMQNAKKSRSSVEESSKRSKHVSTSFDSIALEMVENMSDELAERYISDEPPLLHSSMSDTGPLCQESSESTRLILVEKDRIIDDVATDCISESVRTVFEFSSCSTEVKTNVIMEEVDLSCLSAKSLSDNDTSSEGHDEPKSSLNGYERNERDIDELVPDDNNENSIISFEKSSDGLEYHSEEPKLTNNSIDLKGFFNLGGVGTSQQHIEEVNDPTNPMVGSEIVANGSQVFIQESCNTEKLNAGSLPSFPSENHRESDPKGSGDTEPKFEDHVSEMCSAILQELTPLARESSDNVTYCCYGSNYSSNITPVFQESPESKPLKLVQKELISSKKEGVPEMDLITDHVTDACITNTSTPIEGNEVTGNSSESETEDMRLSTPIEGNEVTGNSSEYETEDMRLSTSLHIQESSETKPLKQVQKELLHLKKEGILKMDWITDHVTEDCTSNTSTSIEGKTITGNMSESENEDKMLSASLHSQEEFSPSSVHRLEVPKDQTAVEFIRGTPSCSNDYRNSAEVNKKLQKVVSNLDELDEEIPVVPMQIGLGALELETEQEIQTNNNTMFEQFHGINSEKATTIQVEKGKSTSPVTEFFAEHTEINIEDKVTKEVNVSLLFKKSIVEVDYLCDSGCNTSVQGITEPCKVGKESAEISPLYSSETPWEESSTPGDFASKFNFHVAVGLEESNRKALLDVETSVDTLTQNLQELDEPESQMIDSGHSIKEPCDRGKENAGASPLCSSGSYMENDSRSPDGVEFNLDPVTHSLVAKPDHDIGDDDLVFTERSADLVENTVNVEGHVATPRHDLQESCGKEKRGRQSCEDGNYFSLSPHGISDPSEVENRDLYSDCETGVETFTDSCVDTTVVSSYSTKVPKEFRSSSSGDVGSRCKTDGNDFSELDFPIFSGNSAGNDNATDFISESANKAGANESHVSVQDDSSNESCRMEKDDVYVDHISQREVELSGDDSPSNFTGSTSCGSPSSLEKEVASQGDVGSGLETDDTEFSELEIHIFSRNSAENDSAAFIHIRESRDALKENRDDAIECHVSVQDGSVDEPCGIGKDDDYIDDMNQRDWDLSGEDNPRNATGSPLYDSHSRMENEVANKESSETKTLKQLQKDLVHSRKEGVVSHMHRVTNYVDDYISETSISLETETVTGDNISEPRFEEQVLHLSSLSQDTPPTSVNHIKMFENQNDLELIWDSPPSTSATRRNAAGDNQPSTPLVSTQGIYEPCEVERRIVGSSPLFSSESLLENDSKSQVTGDNISEPRFEVEVPHQLSSLSQGTPSTSVNHIKMPENQNELDLIWDSPPSKNVTHTNASEDNQPSASQVSTKGTNEPCEVERGNLGSSPLFSSESLLENDSNSQGEKEPTSSLRGIVAVAVKIVEESFDQENNMIQYDEDVSSENEYSELEISPATGTPSHGPVNLSKNEVISEGIDECIHNGISAWEISMFHEGNVENHTANGETTGAVVNEISGLFENSDEIYRKPSLTPDVCSNENSSIKESTPKAVKRRGAMDEINSNLRKMYISSALKEKRINVIRTRLSVPNEMKENVLTSTQKQSLGTPAMGKSVIKRRALEDVQNTTSKRTNSTIC